jgi:hypothetical protein
MAEAANDPASGYAAPPRAPYAQDPARSRGRRFAEPESSTAPPSAG